MRAITCVLVLLLWLQGCAVPVEVDYDTYRDFSQLKNYAWLPFSVEQQRQDPVLYNTLTDKRMRQSIDRVLATKGFRRVNASDADFLLTYHLKVEQKLESDRFGYGLTVMPLHENGRGASCAKYTKSLLSSRRHVDFSS